VVRPLDAQFTASAGCGFNASTPRGLPHPPWAGCLASPAPVASMITPHGRAGRRVEAGPVTARFACRDAGSGQWVARERLHARIRRVLRHAYARCEGHPTDPWPGPWQVVSELHRPGLREQDHAAACFGDRSLRSPLTGQRTGAGLFGDDDCTGSGQSASCAPSPPGGLVP